MNCAMKNIRQSSIRGLNAAALAAAILIALTSHAAAQPGGKKDKQHWAFQKVKPPNIPSPRLIFDGKIEKWVKNPIDAYVLRELEKRGMVPSRHAGEWALLRRVYFDLIGLPPSFDDMQRFRTRQESYEQVVDRLLDSPQYGERWGRHWLDVARYADTAGNKRRTRYSSAYRYRDWVINALNADKPYDQFLIEQIAADRINDGQADLAALGFLTLGPHVGGANEIIDDRIDVITRGTMGLSVYCARCHNHKIDPIPTADYYSLYGVFSSSYETTGPNRTIVLKDKPYPRDEAIRIKGENRRGEVVPRQFLKILSGPNRQPFQFGSGRLELAQAIASKENPLTARVMVNRIWMHHFGKGIVSSINDFGLRATDPSHPELLDYLAWYFTGNNWSMKALHKHILMSNTYQQTSDDNPRYSVKDPDNIYYYKMNRRRLDFEPFRDGLLQVSGVLDLTMEGPPVPLSTGGKSYRRKPNYRRTVYALVDRRNLDDMFNAFDFPNPNSTAGQRSISTTSQQALFMMNNPMLADLTHQIVSRREFTNIKDDRSRIITLYNTIYQRDPKPIELKLGQRFLQGQAGDVHTWYNGFGQWNMYDPTNKFYRINFCQFPYPNVKVRRGNMPSFGPLELTGFGGHPGAHPNSAVIRRWVATRDATVKISGQLEHRLDTKADTAYKRLNPEAKRWYDNNAWDGVTGIIVWSRAIRGSSRLGKELWRSDVRRGRRDAKYGDINVKRGDTIDFIVTCNKRVKQKTLNSIAAIFNLKNPQQDNFTWAPAVNINKEIAAPQTWRKYVQVLLLSNELAYVD